MFLKRVSGKSQLQCSICCLVICLFGTVAHTADPSGPLIRIDSIAELQTYTNASDSHFVMTPGVYTIDAPGVAAGEYGNPFMWISGENNTWDFTGVTFEVNTNFYRAHGDNSVQVLWVVGRNNYIKGLTIKDVGDEHEGPREGSQLVRVHGVDNTLDDCTIMAKGSTPYGYGDMLGKGTGNLTTVHKKSSLQIRGERISILNCSVISRAFGHGIFMQGALDTLIQGTYVEGELRQTSDILKETSGPAFDAGFVNVYDQPNQIQPGWTLSLQEDGIRAYTSGTPYGFSGSRQTRNIRVIDCTVVNMRSGISVNYAKGTKHIEGCVVLDVGTTAYRPGGNSTIVNCSGNATHGALLDLTGTGGGAVKNATVDLTLLPHDQSDINPVVAYIIGKNHTINLYNGGIGMPYTDQEIRVGGTRQTWRHPRGEVINPAENVTFNNYTGYPVVLASTAEDCRVNSAGPIEDSGSGNTTGSLSGTIVTASSHVGLNVPGHTIDGDLTDPNNYWNSHEGIGAWITYALGQEKTIRSIAVLWQDGLLHTYDFDLQVSSDGVWTTVYTGSSLQTGSMETYAFEPADGRYIRLINNGSTNEENYIQIKELNCNFFSSNQPPQVDAGADIATWLVDGVRTETLDATVTCDGAYAVQWTLDPNSPDAVITEPTAEDTSITLSALGEYVLQLKASEGEYAGSDTITINVYNDGCEAAQSLPDYEPSPGDLNDDCIVDFLDLAISLADWLKDTSLTGEYGGSDTVTINVYNDDCEAARSLPDYEPSLGDLNGDCIVDFLDFAILQADWLKDTSLPP